MEYQTNENKTPAQQEPQQTAYSASELGQEECDIMLTPYPLSPTRVEQEDHEFLVDNLGRQWTTGLLYRSTELLSREKEQATAFVPMDDDDDDISTISQISKTSSHTWWASVVTTGLLYYRSTESSVDL
jgi:hypothetical protein